MPIVLTSYKFNVLILNVIINVMLHDCCLSAVNNILNVNVNAKLHVLKFCPPFLLQLPLPVSSIGIIMKIL